MTSRNILPASGKLGILTPGMGAVASTFIAGVLAARQGLKPPIGSISQMAHIRLGTRGEDRNPLIKDFVPLAELDDLVFGGWDPISPNASKPQGPPVFLMAKTFPRSLKNSKASSQWKQFLTSVGFHASMECASKRT